MYRKIDADPGLYFFLALLVLLLPLRWLAAALLAAAVHELCHILAIRLCSGEILDIRLGFGGAVIRAAPMEPLPELLCVLAGPLGGLGLLLLSRVAPRLAICAGFQSAYNLLPLPGLDGGRALECLTAMLLPAATAARFCRLARAACLGMILLLGLYGTFVLRLGVVPLLISLAMLIKFSCKQEPVRLQ